LRRNLRERARDLRAELGTLAIAMRDPRVPWLAKAIAFGVVAYALSPIDLIPDFVPVLGLLDDVILLPLGIMLVRRLIPGDVLAACRAEAERRRLERPAGWWGVLIVVAAWLLVVVVAWFTWRAVG
jgi:uncharacterized membrane protein YkvA (DUF1232 family)